MYVDQIRDLTESCNRHLFAEGDLAFKVGDYHVANERFALASRGLSREANNRYAYFLRAACVYCRLEEYEHASQALLQALHNQQEMDTALEMNKLVNKLSNSLREDPQATEEQEGLSKELDRFVDQTMEGLATRDHRAR